MAFDFESLDYLATDRKFNAYLANFRELPLEKVRQHQHGGKFIDVLKGRLALRVGSDFEYIDAGVSLYFDSTVAARLCAGGEQALQRVGDYGGVG